MSFRSLLFALFLSVCIPAFAAEPLGTSFSFQGYLRQGGNPVDGNTDMVFDLFDAAVGGNQIGPSQIFTAANGNPVLVEGGVFSVNLDFGATAFNVPISEKRYLRMTVNGTTLAPRTSVQSSPYALQARIAELAYFAETVPDASIGSVQIDANSVQRRIVSACSAGSSIRSVAADGSVACQTDTNSGGTITGVTAGSGLTGGGSSGSVSLAVDTNQLQQRVIGVCAPGSSIRTIAIDGSVECQLDANSGGTITGITVGPGLSGGGNAGVVGLDLASPLVLSGTAGSVLSVSNANAATSASPAATFSTTGTANFGAALSASSQTSSSTIGAGALQATVSGSAGTAATFIASNPAGTGVALYASTAGNGVAVQAISNGSGAGMNAIAFGTGPSLYARKPNATTGITAQFENQNPANTSPTVVATSANAPAVSGTSTANTGCAESRLRPGSPAWSASRAPPRALPMACSAPRVRPLVAAYWVTPLPRPACSASPTAATQSVEKRPRAPGLA